MSRTMRFFATLLVALVAAACPAHSRTLSQAATAVKWCIPAAASAAAIANCTFIVAGANTAAVTFTCVAGGTEEECMAMIANSTADLTTLGASSGADAMLLANEKYKLEPIAAEFYGGFQGTNYYSVAVVNKAFCTAGVTLANLKGKRSCHTGYGRTAGWVLPIGYLAESATLVANTSNPLVKADAQSAASFFSSICAPSEDGALVAGGKWEGVCSGCTGDCTPADPYWDYAGAVRCLMEDAGDVAFTKHSTAIDYAMGGAEAQTWSTKSKADLALLCPEGGCKTLDEYAQCYISKAPAYAVMTRPDVKSAALGTNIQTALVAAGQNATLRASLINIPGNGDGFVFSEDTQGVVPVTDNFLTFFGSNTKAAWEGIQSLESTAATPATPTPSTPTPTPSTPAPTTGAANTARWCVPFPADAALLSACSTAAATGNTADVSFECVTGGDDAGCMDMISKGQADLMVLGASAQLPAHEKFAFEAIAAEFYGDLAGASYYAVMVVPKEFCTAGVTPASLKGKRSCHTGYRKTAGWMMPVGSLIASDVIPGVDSNDTVQADAESVASFFSSTCAPETTADGPLLSGGKFDGLCTGCKGDCSESDPYYDYPGSMRCLQEGAGDVAFTKHSSPLEYTKDGSEPQTWSTKNKADLMLLCPAGGCAALDQFTTCNIAKVPARAVMSRADMQSSVMGKAVKDALVKGGTTMVEAMTDVGGKENFVFGPDARSLVPVDVPFMTFYGSTTKDAYQGITSLDALGAEAAQDTAAAGSGSGSSGVSSGAAAGIGIGCAVAGILLGAIGMALVSKRRGGSWQRQANNGNGIMPGSGPVSSDAYKM